MSLNTLKYSFLAKIQFMRQTAKYKCEEPRSFHGTQDINSQPNSWTTEINLLKNGEFVPVDSVKAYAGRRLTSPLNHDPGAGWGDVRSATRPARFIPGKETRYSLKDEWAPETEWTIWRSEKSFAPAEIRYPGPSNPQPIAITTDYANLATELVLNKLRASSLKHQNRITDKTGRLTEGASWNRHDSLSRLQKKKPA